jgi:hypothetical protein
VAFEDTAAGQRVGHNQQIYVAIQFRLTIGARAKQNDHLGVKGYYDALSNLVQ